MEGLSTQGIVGTDGEKRTNTNKGGVKVAEWNVFGRKELQKLHVRG